MRSTDACSGLMFVGMKSRRLLAVSAMVLATALGLVSQTVPPTGLPTTQRANRITQELNAGPSVAIAGTVHPLTRQAIDLGAVDSNLQMGSLTLNIGLSAAQQTELNALSEAQQDPKSPQYHQWLTQEQFGARFGLTDADLSKVTAWLVGQGFTVKKISPSRNAIYFGGKAWQVESALHTQLHQYTLDGETHVANTTDITVPAGIGSVLLNVRGLNNFRVKPQLRKRSAPDYTLPTNNGPVNFMTPADWAAIYDVLPIYRAGYTGMGAHVGVVGQTYAPQVDIDHFRLANNLGATNITYQCIDTNATNCTGTKAISKLGDLGEADLDIEWAGGIAKYATVDYVYAPFSDTLLPSNSALGVFDALQYAVETYKIQATGNVLPVISMSYTECEAGLYVNGVNGALNSDAAFMTTLGLEAQAQGQTIVVSSGDSGAAGCDAQGVIGTDTATGGVWANVPVDSPFYTGVGGTTLSGDETTPSIYWDESGNGVVSAQGYIPETIWNDTSSALGLSASGGGVSTVYPQPTWQSGLISGTTGRLVPDVAFAASPNHDGYLVCSADYDSTTTGTSCTSGFLSSTQYFALAGGTSAGTPSFAGMLTLLTQKYGNLGNINPMLYGFAKTDPTVFNAVTGGNNVIPCTVAATDPGCVGGTMGWVATTGYDRATGLGSIDGGQLYAALGGASLLKPTNTTVLVNPNSVSLGGTTNLTATISSTSSGTITGTVTFYSFGGSNTTLGTATVGNGTATMSNVAVTPANGFSILVGANDIGAAYNGDANFSASSGIAGVQVVAPTYTMVASAPTASLAAGSSASILLNLVSGTYAGTVTFTTAVVPLSGGASNAISAVATPFTLTSGGSGAPTLTITAGTSAAKHTPLTPWKSGGAVVFCAVLLGAPFTIRRKRAVAVLLIAAVIALTGFLMACGGSAKAPRSYTVMVTPTGSGVVANAATVSILVTVR